MRWGYLIPRLIIVIIVWAFFAYGFDPLLRYSATETIQLVTDAKADIENMATGFFPPRASIGRVALASARKPGTNLIEFTEMKLSLAGAPLLRRSYVVDEARVTGVRFGTSRTDDGQLEKDADSDDAGPSIPPWLTEKLRDMGDEWLENFTRQAKAQVDPNRLETYRVGNELYLKWDGRFDDMNVRIRTTKQQLDALELLIKEAKEGDPVERVQKYLLAAQNADLLIRDSRVFINEFKTSVPQEVKHDFAMLDQAQKNDRENVANTIRLLKPDARQITESLLGDEMYLQLQQMLTWVETIRGYIDDIKAPPAPERYRGRDLEFRLLNPTPKILCRKMLIDGELMLSHVPTPFRAVLTDVTSDPQLHGRPALLQVSTQGSTPVQLVIRHDATTEAATTDIAADFTSQNEKKLSAGKKDGDQLLASLTNTHWKARMTLIENRVSGQIDIRSDFGKTEFRTTSPVAAALAGVTQDTLSAISTVTATVRLEGTVLRPQVTMTSDLGEQVLAGFETAFAANLPQMRQQAMSLVAAYAEDQKQKFSEKLGSRYGALLADHETLLKRLDDARTLAMNLRSGQVDPNAVFQQVSQSGLLSDKDQQKADKYMDKVNEVLGGVKDPNTAIQDALPGLRKKLFR